MKYFIKVEDKEEGPYTFEDLLMYEQIGTVAPETSVRLEGHDLWKRWDSMKAIERENEERKVKFQNMLQSTPAVVAGPPKSRGIFIIIGLLFGCIGFHNFYAGYYGRGFIQLAITVLLGWLIIGVVITGLWALVEVVTVTEDGYGTPMR